MEATRQLLTCLFLTLVTGSVTAQTQGQRGIARMITRSATDPIVPVQGVEVVVGNVASSKSDKNGRFSMNIAKNREQSYTLADVRLPHGSNLLLASPSKKKKLFLSKNDLEVALITPEDKNTVSKATYRKLLKKYNAQAEQLRLLRTQLEDQRIDFAETSAEYKSLSTRIDSIQALLNQYYDEKNRENTTKEIERIAEELTLTDYQSLEAEDAHIYDLMQEGDWPTLSKYLLKLMNGDAAAYVQEAVDNNNAAKELYEKTSQELAHRLERLQNAIESYKMQHLNDSVSHYYEILCKADSTNWEYFNQAGLWECDYNANYDKAKIYHATAFKCAKVDTLKAASCYNLGRSLENEGQYSLAYLFYQGVDSIMRTKYGKNNMLGVESLRGRASIQYKQGKRSVQLYMEFYVILELCKSVYGKDSPKVAESYDDIGTFDLFICKYDMALNEYKEGLKLKINAYGKCSPKVAMSFIHIGNVFHAQHNDSLAMKYYLKALSIQKNTLNDEHPDIANTYNNIGLVYLLQGNDSLSLVSLEKALAIQNVSLRNNHPNIAQTYYNIATVYKQRKDTLNTLFYLWNSYDVMTRVQAVGFLKSKDKEEALKSEIDNLASQTNKEIIEEWKRLIECQRENDALVQLWASRRLEFKLRDEKNKEIVHKLTEILQEIFSWNKSSPR